jgi:hypothetical protein
LQWDFLGIICADTLIKKKIKIFPINKEIQSGAVANISPYLRRPLVIYDFATAPF